jgi:hypothetical protein
MFVKGIYCITILMFITFAFGCATLTVGDKPLTPKQQATIIMNTYNAEYDDTMSMATNPNSTPAQKEIVAQKKMILTQIWPLLKVYVSIVDGGGTPTENQTQALLDLINQLTVLSTGVK